MKKQREFSLVSYLPTHLEVQQVLNEKEQQILSYAYILHDKDIYLKDEYDKETNELKHARGELKEPHFHIYLRLQTDRLPNEICRWFVQKDITGNSVANCFSKTVQNRVSVLKYLTHKTKGAENKYQYDDREVTVFNCDNIFEDMPKDESFDVINDIIDGMSTRELVKRYGRDYIYHWQQYRDIAQHIQFEENLSI